MILLGLEIEMDTKNGNAVNTVNANEWFHTFQDGNMISILPAMEKLDGSVDYNIRKFTMKLSCSRKFVWKYEMQ